MVQSTNGSAAGGGNPPSPTPSMVSISSSEYDQWFRYDHGRRFHAMATALYPFPCDREEMERLDIQHAMLRTHLRSHFFGPVPDVLQQPQDSHAPQKVVLDLGSGSGQWADDMALDFAHVHFFAVDLAPIAPQFPQANVDYECYDLFTPEGFRNNTGSVTLVHARFISFGIKSYQHLINESARVLMPGGLFLSGEYDPMFVTADGSNLAESAPSLSRTTILLEQCLQQLEIVPVAGHIAEWLREGDRFTAVTEAVHRVPVGRGWHDGDARLDQVGAEAERMLVSWSGSIRPLLLTRSGESQTDIDQLLENFRQEVQEKHVYMVYRAIHARRV